MSGFRLQQQDSPPDTRSQPKKPPLVTDDHHESSPILQKNSPKLQLSQIHFSPLKKELNFVPNPIPVRVNYQPLENTQKVRYQRVDFEYNPEVEKTADFGSFDWSRFHYSNFLSYMHSHKQTPRDFLRYAKNNHREHSYLSSPEAISDKLIEIAYFDSEVGPLSQILFSGDRKLIISVAEQDNVIKLWDLNELRLRSTLEGHDDRITSATVCFRSETLITTGLDGNLILWDLDRMEENNRISGAHIQETTKILLSNDESLLFLISRDGFFRILDLQTLKFLRVFEVIDKKALLDVCLSEDERTLVLCGNDIKIHVWSKPKDDLFFPSFVLVSDNFQAFSQVGFIKANSRTKLLTLAEDSSIILWDFELRIQERTLVSHIHQISKFAVLSETEQIISISRQNFLQVWSVSNGRELARKKASVQLRGLDVFRKRNDFGNLYKFQVITSSAESIITLWGATENSIFRRILQFNKPITHLKATLDNNYVIFAAENAIHLLDLATNKIEKSFCSHTAPITSLFLASDSKTLVSGGGKGNFSIKIWEIEKEGAGETLKKHTSEVIFIGISSDFVSMVSGSADQTIVLWDFKKRQEKGEKKNVGMMTKISFKQNDEFFTAGKEGTIKQWRVSPLEEIRAFSAHSKEIVGLEYKERKKLLVSGSLDYTLKIWKFEGDQALLEKVIENNAAILDFVVASDEKNIVLVDKRKMAKSFEVETAALEETLDLTIKTNENICLLNAFHDCKKLIFAGDGGGLFVWDYRDPVYSLIFVLNDILESKLQNETVLKMFDNFLCKSFLSEFIYPTQTTFLHYLAYLGETDKMRQVFSILNQKKPFTLIFQRDLFGNTPIDIFLDQKDMNSVYFLLNLAIENVPPIHAFPNLTDNLQKIAKLDFPRIAKLLDSRILTISQSMEHRLNQQGNQFIRFPSAFFQGKRVESLPSASVPPQEQLINKSLILAAKQDQAVYSTSLKIIDIPDLLSRTFEARKNPIFEDLAQKEEILDSEVMRLLIQHKWQKYAERIYSIRMGFYFFVVLMLVVYSVWLLPLRVRFIDDFSKITRYGLVNLIFLCFLSFFSLIFLLGELYKFFSLGLIRYLFFLKNIYFILSLSLLIVTLIFDWCGLYNVYFDEDLTRNLHSFNLFFFTLGFLFFLKPFNCFNFGRLFFKVLDNIKMFIFLLVILIYNFGFVIWILDESWSFAENGSDENTIVYWKEPFETFDIVYRIMIRDFNSFDSQPRPLYMIVLWVFFLITTFLIIIIVVNIFIAVVFELEQELRQNKERAVLRERCEIIVDIDRTFCRGRFEKYFFISRIFDENYEKNQMNDEKIEKDWDFRMMEQRITERLKEIERSMSRRKFDEDGI